MDKQQAVKLTALPWGWVNKGWPERLEAWIERAGRLRLDGLELLDGWFNDERRTMARIGRTTRAMRKECFQPKWVNRVGSLLQSRQMRLGLLTVHNDFYCFSAAERQAERDRMRIVFEVADQLNCDIIRIIPGHRSNEKRPAKELVRIVVDMIRLVLDDLGPRQQKLALENAPRVFRNFELFFEVVEAIDHPKFGVNFDTKHVEGSAVAAASQIADSGKLVSAHIDNYLGDWPSWERNVSLAEGALDIAELVHVLRRGQPLWFSNEFGGSDINKVYQNISFLDTLLSK